MDHAYRSALDECARRYLDMAADIPDIRDFIFEFQHFIKGEPNERFHGTSKPYPLMKLNRWLGYIQGVLIERGITTVDAERDWTRPLFRPLDFCHSPDKMSISEFCKQHHNDIVLVHDQHIGRLVGFETDMDDIYYVVLLQLCRPLHHHEVVPPL